MTVFPGWQPHQRVEASRRRRVAKPARRLRRSDSCGTVVPTRVVDFVAICSYIVRHEDRIDPRRKEPPDRARPRSGTGRNGCRHRNGRPAFDLVPHQTRKGLRLEAIDEFKRKHRIKAIVPYIADDFEAPLPEGFLLRPLPVDR